MSALRLFLSGDVMLGRGIDQILPHPGDPRLHEEYVKSAEDYVALAERASGPIPRRVPFCYVWGDLLDDLEALGCDRRVINLETAITTADQPEPKGINYRMNPANIGVLSAARVDACVLANNHVLDWGREGLIETLDTLENAGIAVVGAGRSAEEAAAPLALETPGKGRVLILAFGDASSGIPAHWAAGPTRPGINPLPRRTETFVAEVRRRLEPIRRRGDLVVVSIHWGGNWGHEVPRWQREMAHALIDEAGVQVIHGHSSHHPKAAELHGGGLILYGCGDLINDYEGIGGYEEFRPDLVLAWLVEAPAKGSAAPQLTMLPYRLHRFRLNRATPEEADWLARTMDRLARRFGGEVRATAPGQLRLFSQGDPGLG